MVKKIMLSGIMGGVAMSLWTFIVNGILRFGVMMNMKVLPNEPQVYELLKSSVIEPGRYVVNPTPSELTGYPLDEPVFALLYSGVGHESAGMLMWIGLVIVFGATLMAAWMLSRTSTSYRSSYVRRVLFFTFVGVLFAISIDLDSFGIGGRPFADAVVLGAHRIAMWTFLGSIAAWFMKPETGGNES